MTLSRAATKVLIGVAVVSLCVNLFLVGSMAGRWFDGSRGHGGPRGGIEAMIAGMPEDLRPLIKQKFDAAKPQFQAQREKIRAARQKVAQAAQADPFDPAAFDAAFKEFQAAMDGMGTLAHQTIGEILPQIPAEQRKVLVDKWAKRWGPKGDGPDGPPPDAPDHN
jgi:uncharacterized membrane protein